ncbi:MAG TPA: response regulator transcription factor [Baekduia sp.]|nr:response regulator transcription factor [Baekduia sp.]
MIRVLVVDDHPAMRAGLESVLRSEPGFRCLGAAASADAMWPLVRRHRPDVVVLDVRLGKDDGISLCRELRAEPEAPAVVILTADADPSTVGAATAAGASATLDKATPLDVLLDAVRVATRTRAAA